VKAAAAQQELTALFKHAGGFDPGFADVKPQIRVSRPQDDLPFREALILLSGAVILLLLIACSNVSHLLLQRGLTRERELAIRHALGAHRVRLVRQLVTESALLALAGGVLAMLVGWGVLALLIRLRPLSLPELSDLSSSRGVIPVAAGLALAVGLIVGVLGALHVAHKHLAQSLRTGASTATRTHRRLRGTLVVGQIALSAILLAGAIILIRGVIDLERQQLGFDPVATTTAKVARQNATKARENFITTYHTAACLRQLMALHVPNRLSSLLADAPHLSLIRRNVHAPSMAPSYSSILAAYVCCTRLARRPGLKCCRSILSSPAPWSWRFQVAEHRSLSGRLHDRR
jgi:hypothetical protein